MTTTRWLWVAALAACGGSSSKTPMPDAPSAPAMITISGTATSRSLSGTTPVSGAMVGAFKSDDTMVAMTTTDASGNYSLTVPTGGVALDGYVKASMSGYLDTYLYAPAPLTADFSMASINMLTPDNFNLLSTTLCDANQMTSMGTIPSRMIRCP